ncbi:MAG: S-layer homology domain-containing protein [Oscillospiraceae bacterium]|jgi:hypothetical protein
MPIPGKKKSRIVRSVFCLFLAAATVALTVFPQYVSAASAKNSTEKSASAPKLELDGTQSQWAEPEILDAYELGLTYPDILNQFKKDITRYEFCMMVIRLYEKLTGRQAVVGDDPFTDTDSPDILKAYNLKIVNGTSATTFDPDAKVERQQIACFIDRALAAANRKDAASLLTDSFPFDDASKVASWAIESMKFCYRSEILQGYNRQISPLGNTTREQAIAIIRRTYHKFKGASGELSFIDSLNIIKPSVDLSMLPLEGIAVEIPDLTNISEEAKYDAIDFEAGDLFFPKFDTRLELYVAMTSEKPGSKPSVSVVTAQASPGFTALTPIPTNPLQPIPTKPLQPIPTNPLQPIPVNPLQPVKPTTPFSPAASWYTNASHTAFIDGEGDQTRWFYYYLSNTSGAAKVVWQVAMSPFDGYANNWRNPTGLVASGEVPASAGEFKIDFGSFSWKYQGNPAIQDRKVYYVRAVPVTAAGQPIGDPGEGLAVLYGKKTTDEPNQTVIQSSFELWTPKYTHQGRSAREFYDPPQLLYEAKFDCESSFPRFFHFHGIDSDVHSLIIQVSSVPFPAAGGGWPETPALVFEKEFSLPTNTYANAESAECIELTDQQFPATVPVDFHDFAPPADQLKPGESKKYYVRGITLKSTDGPGIMEAKYSQQITVSYHKKEPITVIVPKVEYVNAALPQVRIKSYTPAQWETSDYMQHYRVYRAPAWHEINSKWVNTQTGVELYPYFFYKDQYTTAQYESLIIPQVLPVGAEVYFPPPKHKDQAWYEDLWDMVCSFFENLWDAVCEIYNAAQSAYNGLKAAIINNLANLCPIPSLRDEFKAALELMANTGLMAIGLPPSLPNMDKLMEQGVDYLAGVALAEAGIPPNDITDAMVKEIAGGIQSEIEKSGNRPDSNPIDSPFLELNPRKIYRPAYIDLEVKNPSTKVATVPGSIDLNVTFEIDGNNVSELGMQFPSNHIPGSDAAIDDYLRYSKHFVFGLSGGWEDIYNSGDTIVYNVFLPVTGWTIPSVQPGKTETIRIYLQPKMYGIQYPYGDQMEEDDFYNMYFMNYGYTHFTLRQSYPTPVEYVREILKYNLDTSQADIFLYHGETCNSIGPVTPHSYNTEEKINKPVRTYWSR